mmetsp:Transcript_9483/g.9542  ORF Transcript_9483/g.9542 Transcript_9483/m.9542 type:complete len:154 (+) Transcript_9483:170-631(+)
MNSGAKRLRKEFINLKDNHDDAISLEVDEENIFKWTATLKGPRDTPYEGYQFKIAIQCQNDYPLTPPTMIFQTKIFHPNVHFDTGEICLDILKKQWSPVWSLQSACRAVLSLLSDPAPDSPLNCDAGNMLRAGDHRAYRCVTKMYCVEYATTC